MPGFRALLACGLLGAATAARTHLGERAVLSGDGDADEKRRRHDLVAKISLHPYRYDEYAAVLAGLSPEELKLGGPEVDKTPDAVRELVLGILRQHAPAYERYADQALHYERLVNRALVLQDEILSGRYFTTMAMKSQSLDLAVLLPGLWKLGGGLNVLFAGCGVGDWAAETALAVAEGSKVWCWNHGALTMNLGKSLFQGHSVEDVFDVPALQPQQVTAAKQVHEGSKLRYVCSEAGNAACGAQERGGLLTTQPKASADIFGGGERYDAIVYGNGLTPDELADVKAALRDSRSFALVPVCLNGYSKHDKLAAPWYCEGFYWKIGKSTEEGPLMPFPGVMRPLGAPSAAGLTRGAEHYAPAGWRPSK